jgi:hypothetical protein
VPAIFIFDKQGLPGTVRKISAGIIVCCVAITEQVLRLFSDELAAILFEAKHNN